MKNPLRQFVFNTLISLLLIAGFIYFGIENENWLYLAAAGITLFSWFISTLGLRRLYRNKKILDEALICPECKTAGGLDFDILSQVHEGKQMHAEIQEHCTHCDYHSGPEKLIYPLDKEIAALMETEAQPRNIANRSAEDAWYRNKVLRMVQD